MNIPAGIFVLGLGSDLCNIDRIENSVTRFGDRFINRIYTPHERARAERRPITRFGTYAKRFAAKEACSKALGTGFRRGVFWRDMGVVNLPSGAPTLALTGGAAARLAEITPAGHIAEIHLTMTDDRPWAQAIVLITARPL
ncbi:holo-[acyl-carrier-protein] synthase [Polymorphobacter glacialis]|uniref:Holo-[acyl-carrier-protein] synthase n=1 Tax=Sandarakinorhabdus glacialis TaxID=1614636 RepID=A0A916ZVR5_9SPHN|nr:holo-ACP synthase [Polymorphobacter glacialis]GGE15516.1 holo-[acyl-carrier-protein] synthase [Polymorphobacter glacialis]